MRSSHEQCVIISHNVLIFLNGQVEDRVFWSDAKLDRLESANLDGSDRVEVLKVKLLYIKTCCDNNCWKLSNSLSILI